jgi:hypothetical protein
LIVSGLIDVSRYEDYPIGLHFEDLLPIDDLMAAQTALILDQIGVSKATYMAQLGYNADEEIHKSAKEAKVKQALMPKPEPQQLPPRTPGQSNQPGQVPQSQQGASPANGGQQP